MPWYDSVAGLTALAAHDTSNVSGGALVDLLGGGNPAGLSGQTIFKQQASSDGKVYNVISVADARVRYTNEVVYPQTGCTVFAFFFHRSGSGNNTLFHARDSGSSHLMVYEPNYSGSQSRIRNEGTTGTNSVLFTPDTSKPVFIALSFTGTTGRWYYNNDWLTTTANINSGGNPAVSTRGVTYDNTWNLKQGLIAIGVFDGAATLTQLQDLENALRTQLAITDTTIIDETFATDIPADFNGSWIVQSTQSGVSATYNATAQAVDLIQPNNQQAYWAIGKSAYLLDCEVEADIELISDVSTGGRKHAGFWLNTGSSANGIRFYHLDNGWSVSYWPSSSWSGELYFTGRVETTSTTFNVGDRRVIKAKLRNTATSWEQTTIAFYVDDIFQFEVPYYAWRPQLRVGIFVYGATVRLHSVKQIAATDLNSEVGTVQYDPESYTGRLFAELNRPTYPVFNGLNPRSYLGKALELGKQRSAKANDPNLLLGWIPNDTPTIGFIEGTTKTSALPSNIPIKCTVGLFLDPAGEPVASTISDPVTGNYRFDNLPLGQRFMVVAYHPSRTFRAVLADNLLPEVTP